jgi:hypothetical protein
MSKILTIQSRQLNSNLGLVHRRNETFHQSNQKHNKKLMKIIAMLLNLFFICLNVQN